MSKPLTPDQAENRKAHIDAILAKWPPLTPHQINLVAILLGPEGADVHVPRQPSAYELEQRRKEQERADALKKAKKAAEAITACDVCNLQPEVHGIRRAQGADMHEWQPGRAEKLMKRRIKK